MADEEPVRGSWLVGAALVVAAVLALVAYAVARFLLGADLELLPTLVTAVVVGAFFSLFLARPLQKRTTFTVDSEAVEEEEETEEAGKGPG